MESKSYFNPKSLYSHCVASYVKHLKPKTSQLDEIDGLQTLPPNILADIYLAVSWKMICHNYIPLLCTSIFLYHFVFLVVSHLIAITRNAWEPFKLLYYFAICLYIVSA